MVHVEIDDGHALQAPGQGLGRTHGDVVEQAETHGGVARGVVAGRPHGAEGALAAAVQHRVHRRDEGAGRTQGGVERAGRQAGVGIEVMRAALRHRGEHRVDLRLRVHARELGARGARRLHAIQRGEAVVVQRLQHRAQPVRALRMTGAGVVIEAGGVGEQEHGRAGGRGRISGRGAGDGTRAPHYFLRFSCCHSTSPWPLARASTRASTNSRSDRRLR